MRTTKHVLIDGARRILRDRGWCQEALAKTKKGRVIGFPSEGAENFCLIGAVHRARDDAGLPETATNSVLDALYYLALKRGYWSVADWNDAKGRTKEEVLALLDEAEKKL